MQTAIISLREIQVRTIEPVPSTNSTAVAQVAITTASQLGPTDNSFNVASEPDDGESPTIVRNPELCQANVGKTIAVSPAKINIYSISQWAIEKMYDFSTREW